MSKEENFYGFFNENYEMTVKTHEHCRYVDFIIDDDSGHRIEFKLKQQDIGLLESILACAKKY